MPFYDFKCSVCEKKIEIYVNLEGYESLKDSLKCPDCSGKMNRVFYPVPIHGFGYPGQVDRTNGGDYDEMKDEQLALKTLEDKGELDKLSPIEQKFYEQRHGKL